MTKENGKQQRERSKEDTSKTKQITATLPIEYWNQLQSMQKTGEFEGWPIDKIIGQLIMERLDKEYIDQKNFAVKQLNNIKGAINRIFGELSKRKKWMRK